MQDKISQQTVYVCIHFIMASSVVFSCFWVFFFVNWLSFPTTSEATSRISEANDAGFIRVPFWNVCSHVRNQGVCMDMLSSMYPEETTLNLVDTAISMITKSEDTGTQALGNINYLLARPTEQKEHLDYCFSRYLTTVTSDLPRIKKIS